MPEGGEVRAGGGQGPGDPLHPRRLGQGPGHHHQLRARAPLILQVTPTYLILVHTMFVKGQSHKVVDFWFFSPELGTLSIPILGRQVPSYRTL